MVLTMSTAGITASLFLLASAAAAATCESLIDLSLANTTLALAQTVPAGDFKPSSGAAVKDVPAFCRVAGTITPSTDSNIKFEVWMPASGWNGKFQGVGNGGFAGSLSLGQMALPLRRGYASATTDTGHSGNDAAWALGRPEKLTDYGYRGVHEMTEKAKAIITAFYGKGPSKSYFSSCSNGGRQALMEVQRYPGDYDGVIAGAPANNFTRIAAGFLWDVQALGMNPASYIPIAKLKAIEKAALQACDAKDGLEDGLIDSPSKCRFDPGVLLCGESESESCLTAPQVAALKKIYDGPKTSKGESVFPGFVPGGETGPGGWGAWINGSELEKSLQFFFATQMMRNMVLENPAWDYKSFQIDRDVKLIDDKLGRVLNATDPNLKPFQSRGGKLILYHGWCDAALTPLNTINYYNSVVAKVGVKKAAQFVRLYMVPGMQHCAGGPGPANIWGSGASSTPENDMLLALDRWVEKGVAPAAITASKPSRTRPICPYPQVARYKGTGSIDEAASFSCAAPETPKK